MPPTVAVSTRASRYPSAPPSAPPTHAEQQDLHAEGRRDLAAPGAEAAEHAGVVAPRHDGEHRGVVDEEDAHEQRQQREGLEVDAEGPEHRLHRERPLAAGLHEKPGAPAPPEAGLVVEDEVDPVHDARGVQQPLRLPDVHHHERLARRAGEQPREPQTAAGRRERRPGLERERRGETSLHQHRRRVAEQLEKAAAGSVAPGDVEELRAQGDVEEGVDAEEPDLLPRAEPQATVEDGGQGADRRVARERRQQRLLERAGRPLDGVRRRALEKRDRPREARERGARRQRHPDGRRHPARHAEDLQRGEHAVAQQLAQERPRDRLHGVVSAGASAPSAMRRTRSALCAASGACVAISSAAPASRQRRLSSSST